MNKVLVLVVAGVCIVFGMVTLKVIVDSAIHSQIESQIAEFNKTCPKELQPGISMEHVTYTRRQKLITCNIRILDQALFDMNKAHARQGQNEAEAMFAKNGRLVSVFASGDVDIDYVIWSPDSSDRIVYHIDSKALRRKRYLGR